MAAYTTIDNPELFFQCKLFTGTGSALSVTLDGDENMQPDLVWIKERSASDSAHNLTDSVRGAGKGLFSNTSAAEYDYGTGSDGTVRSFDSDGFTLGTATQVNPSSVTMVAWCWKAGTSFSNDASATGVGSIDSTASTSSTAGFSIVSYTGTGSNATVGHGLGVAPKVVIVKRRSQSGQWVMGHSSLGFTKFLELDLTGASQTSSLRFNDTAPTSSVFSVGTTYDTNQSGTTIIAYCFAEKQGFSKFGSYTGNGNADGAFIYTGFRPAWFMQKNTTDAADNWHIFDTKRDTGNQTDEMLFANASSAEATGNAIDLLSNGVKIRNTSNGMNGSGDNYIFMAFAEQPFVNSKGVPANAR
tara:strand:- start:35 stop:1105 length:1071 start_codon:yes stop_codon:yes gene_type:complete